MYIKHSNPTISQDDVERVAQAVSSGHLADYSEVSEFEQEMANYIGQKGGVATNSGTSALYLSLLSLGNNEKNEVIIPSYVCIALLNALSYNKLKPKIVDINEHNYNISHEEIKKNIDKKTKAIILPHMFGDPIKNIEEIVNLEIPVIEDCALSVGASVNGKKIGSFSQLSVFSFYATKVLTTGHGGMVLSNSEEKLNRMRDCIQYDKRQEYRESFNFRMTDFQAALGRSQLSKLEDFIKKRREIAKTYDKNLKNNKNMKILDREGSIFFRYIIEVENADKFIKKISEKGIQCSKPIFKPLHRYLSLDRKSFPNTEKAFESCVSIPIYPSMTKDEIDYVIEKINQMQL